MRSVLSAGVFAAAALVGSMSQAATLGLTTTDPSVTASDSIVEVLECCGFNEVFGFDAVIDSSTGVTPNGLGLLEFGFDYNLSDPTGDFSGAFGIFDDDIGDPEFLSGELIAIGFLEDVIELQFGNLLGRAAGDFNSSVLAVISFADPLGTNPLDSLADGDFLSASITISNVVAPIPLPAGLPLMLGGFGTLLVLRRKQKAA